MNTTLEQTQQQSVTIRVVFDGAPLAGKTTAAYSLGEALGGQAVTPAEDSGRTTWFDWMSYSAGSHEGRPVRVELVTVPGQADLADRRDHLLHWGDVVVFIADTSKASFDESAAKFSELRSGIASYDDIPVVVLANKRDLDDALPIEAVRSGLGLDDSDIVVEGIATSGGGVQEAFVLAVRAALENPTAHVDPTTADELLAEMQAVFSTAADHAAPAVATGMAASHDAVASDLADTDPTEDAGWEDTAVVDEVADESVAEPLEVEADTDPTEDAGWEDPVVVDETTEESATDVEAAHDELEEGSINDAGWEAPVAVDARNELSSPALEGDPEVSPPALDGEPELDGGSVEPGMAVDGGASAELTTDEQPDVPSSDSDRIGSLFTHARLNPDGIADGAAIVILADHWRVLVDIANGVSLSSDENSDDAAIALELATWGLINSDTVHESNAGEESSVDDANLDVALPNRTLDT